jgi:ElaB/YqjD/DUF883 family membrane-anchored ribosome-binding protein
MPERLYRSSDVPEYGTYPESPRAVTDAEGITARSRAPRVDTRDQSSSPSKITEMKAKASGLMEDASARAGELKSQASHALDEASARASELTAQASDALDDAKVRANEWKDEALATGSIWMEVAKRNASRAGRKARDYSRTAVRDYPLQVIAGAAVVGLLFGIGLRAWREHRV